MHKNPKQKHENFVNGKYLIIIIYKYCMPAQNILKFCLQDRLEKKYKYNF